jgi:hypothetical protein
VAKKRKKGSTPKRPQSAADIEDFIFDVEEASEYLRILTYGFNGSQKTRFAATAPKCLIIDVQEEGSKSTIGIQPRGQVKVFPAKTWSDVVLAFWYLKDYNHPFESFAIDTVTGMADVCMKRVLREKSERNPNEDPKIPGRPDWNKQYQLMRDQLLAFRNLPLHMILLAQERVIGNEDEGEPIRHVPELPGRVRGAAMSSVDVIGRIYQREVKIKGKKKVKWEPRMLVGPHEDYESKNRVGGGEGTELSLPRIIRKPTVPMFIEALQALQKEA